MSFLSYLQDLIAGFDQEAAAAVMARLVSFKMETEVIFNLQSLGITFESRVFNYTHAHIQSEGKNSISQNEQT